jgi:hypothetical protein
LSIAQDADVTKYFNDGGIGNPRNAFKVDILQAVAGDVTFHYERFLHDVFSMEVGVGFLRGKYIPPMMELFEANQLYSERDGGFKFVITPMFHPYEDTRQGLIYGLQFFVRENKNILAERAGEPYTYDRKDTYFGYYQGYRFEIGDYMSMELAFSAGFIFYEGQSVNTTYGSGLIENGQFNALMSFKLAFHK